MQSVLAMVVVSLILAVSSLALALGRTGRTMRAVGDWLTNVRDDPERLNDTEIHQTRIGDAVVDVDDWISPKRATKGPHTLPWRGG